mmetsp:Transcript_1710/g.3700  ORF Transcript_1710/g.3700 Transcript_1710/m.3700 type:complete len:380 (+) Transcript_1710:152-1291(+)
MCCRKLSFRVKRGERRRRRRRSAASISASLCHFVLLSSGPVLVASSLRSVWPCFVPSSHTGNGRHTHFSHGLHPRGAFSSPEFLSAVSDDADEITSSSDRDNEKSTNEDGLTAQERILRSAGLSAETSEERFARLQRRTEAEEKLKSEKRTNIAVAILAFLAAFLNYGWNYTHPVTPVQVLAEMQSTSAPLDVIGRNGKPTVVDFWAPWCENCKMSAPTLQAIEKEYEGKVNFVLVNADAGSAWQMVERFGVDAIPHLAMISAEGDVETALIGPIPRGVLRADIDVLLDNASKGAKGGNEACVAESNIDQEGKAGAGTIASSSVAVAGSSGVVVPYDVPNEPAAAGQQTPVSCDQEKDELPYVMLDVFRNRPEMRRVNF